jgi:Ser/Thr protein kinase RdoA (MazF antagonist)
LPIGCAPHRHAHGDLKASNLLFDEAGLGLCVVDLDTLARMPWAFELGDALRSWCNPHGEDHPDIRVDEAMFAAAVAGYATAAARPSIEAGEVELVVRGLYTIATELGVRFLTDALEEQYFGFDRSTYPARGEHNLVRAKGQLALARSVLHAEARLDAIVRRAFDR